MPMPYGFRIKQSWTRVDDAIVAAFRELPAANVSDSMQRLAAAGPAIQPMHGGAVLCGAALTVRCRPGDNLMIHKAIDMAEPGDVIVVDASGDLSNSLMGELMLVHAIQRGVAGFVLNGAIRDSAAIAERGLPVFACGVTHRGPYRTGPGEIGFPIALDGMPIAPGDLILGDADGVVCVPRADAATVLEGARKKKAAEDRQMRDTLAGTLDRSWVDKALEAAGCELIA